MAVLGGTRCINDPADLHAGSIHAGLDLGQGTNNNL